MSSQRKGSSRKKKQPPLLVVLVVLVIVIISRINAQNEDSSYENNTNGEKGTIEREYVSKNHETQMSLATMAATLEEVPEYEEEPYVVINDNEPYFEEDDYTTEPFEYYSELDDLGRCQVTYANICEETMPTEERQQIGSVKPTGWQTIKYDNVDGKYLYNRCHLIGFQLAGENANEKNLITGTRYLNVQGMLPFENMVHDYVKETDHHVLYRVTPIFEGDNLIASGVLIEAYSVEDEGEGICFNVYCYNVQPDIEIDYATGESQWDGE